MTRARRRFGQHFLESGWAARIIDLIAPQPDEAFVEIGPGHGALTRPLAARAREVIAFEIDRDLAAELRATVASNVMIVEGDFLEQPFDWPYNAPVNAATRSADRTFAPDREAPRTNHGARRLRVAANLPYNVATPVLFKLVRLFDSGVPFADATLMVQREVADRLLARPGSKAYGVLTILIGHSASVTRLLNLPPGAFRPSPKVNSTVVRLSFHSPDPMVRDRSLFGALVQAVFTRRRKTMVNALQAFEPARARPVPPWLDPRRRPETLSIDEFARLADDFST